MPSSTEPLRPSHEALVCLEKSSNSPTSLLKDAAQILGIELALCTGNPASSTTVKARTASAPKAEWVLRWLLKKLKRSKQFRVHPFSFLLLTQLIGLIRPKTLAIILTDYDFSPVLSNVFSDVEESAFASLEDGSPSAGSAPNLGLNCSPYRNESNNMKGTKRKRVSDSAGGDSMEVDDALQSPTTDLRTFVYLLECLYNLVVLATETLREDDVTRSRITQALRAEPEPSAIMLAKSFRIAAVMTMYFSQRRMTADLQHLMYVIPAVLGIWHLRTSKTGPEVKVIDGYFAKYCFSEALKFQHCISLIELDTDERFQTLFGVQRLIAIHVVLPTRARFFEGGGSGIDYSADEPDWSAVKPVTDNFIHLLYRGEDQKGRGLMSAGADRMAELLPGFFDIAARCVPRDTFRRKVHEAPWLETLFVAAAELAFSFAKQENPSAYSSKFVGILEELFKIALDRDVNLSLPTLVTHAAYSGLFADEISQVEWNFTALLVRLGVDIFLPNSGFSESRRLLMALLEKIMLYWRSGASGDDYEIIKHGIVIPLMRGFTAARDLPTFIDLWHEQLVVMERDRTCNNSLSCFSVFEDDDLCATYAELAQAPFMDGHVNAQLLAVAADIKGADGRVSPSPRSYAKFVVLEASLRSKSLDPIATSESLHLIVEAVSANLSAKQSLHWRWRLWRFVRGLLECGLRPISVAFGSCVADLVEIAAKSIRRRHKNFSKDPYVSLENLEAYRLTLAVMKVSTVPTRLAKFNSITGEVVRFIKSVPCSDAAKSTSSPWNGRMETLNSQSSLALSYFLLLVENPGIWGQIEVGTRQDLFGHILDLAASQYNSQPLVFDDALSDAKFLQAWASVACHEYLFNTPCIIGDLIHVIAERFNSDAVNRGLYVVSFQRIPASSLNRRQRGVILDLVQEAIIQQDSTRDITAGVISLMAKLADLPKSPAVVTSDWEPIWRMAEAVVLEGSDVDLEIVKAFRNLHLAVISKLLNLSLQERSKQFSKLFCKLVSLVSHMKSIDRCSMEHALLRISASHLWSHRKEISGVVEEPQLNSCRGKIFDLVVNSIKQVKKACDRRKPEGRILMAVTLDMLTDFQDLAIRNEEVRGLLQDIERYMENSAEPESEVRRLVRRHVLASQEPGDEIIRSVTQCAEIFPVREIYEEEQQRFIQIAMQKLRSATIYDLVQILEEITADRAIRGENEHLLLIAALVATALPPVEDKSGRAAEQLSLLFAAVSQSLSRCRSIEQFTLATECLDILFRRHPRCVGQFDVDGLLAAVSLCLSRHGPHINSKHASTVFIRLCRLVGIIVGPIRMRIGGRHHLILNILTRLLSCLLERTKKQGGTQEKDRNQPHWAAPLQAADATHFTRLLTSLSDPTLSSVTRTGTRGSLTDQTKKVKRITGQYLQYFVMSYARLCLQGTFSPQVKAAIMPGLYSVLSVLSHDTMRSLNANLEVSSRAVFKGLYDDFVKFGKWNKT